MSFLIFKSNLFYHRSMFINRSLLITHRLLEFSILSSSSRLPIDLPETRKRHSLKKWSYCSGTADHPLIGATIGQLMERAAENHPNKEAFVFVEQGIKLNYEELIQRCDKIAAGLMTLGARYQDRIGIWAPNCAEWILMQYATARAGMILVNINPTYQAPELEFCLNNVGIKILVMSEKIKHQDFYSILHRVCPELATQTSSISSQRLPELKHVILIGNERKPGTIPFSDLLSSASNEEVRKISDIQNKLQFDDSINIQFTSGTTGLPKGATLSHHNIINNALFVGYRLSYHEKDIRVCCPVPLYHCFGMVLGSLQSLCHSATVILPSYVFNPQKTIEAVEKEKCTTLYGTPTMFIDYLNQSDLSNRDLSSLDTGIMAGAVCPVEVMKQCVILLGMKHIANCYGTTENSPITFQSLFDDPFEKRMTTVGKILDHAEAKIVDSDENVVPVGETGELYTRGYMTMKGYWGNEDQTKATMSDNWYKTGDLAFFDEEGYCTIIGRKKDMLIRGGENIYPAEIEQILYKHPCVVDVQVIGVPDKRLGEQIAAWIILKDGKSITEQDIRDYCKDKMAYFKIPHYVTFVNKYPLTVTGKVQKYKMRKEALKLYDLEHLDK